MGSTKVVTEKKALKRLGSEMSDSMKLLQIKSERKEKEQKEEENRRGIVNVPTAIITDLSGDGAGGWGSDGAGASGDKIHRASTPNSRIGSPGSFGSSAMARRATRLLTEVPKFISDMGISGSKSDLAK